MCHVAPIRIHNQSLHTHQWHACERTHAHTHTNTHTHTHNMRASNKREGCREAVQHRREHSVALKIRSVSPHRPTTLRVCVRVCVGVCVWVTEIDRACVCQNILSCWLQLAVAASSNPNQHTRLATTTTRHCACNPQSITAVLRNPAPVNSPQWGSTTRERCARQEKRSMLLCPQAER